MKPNEYLNIVIALGIPILTAIFAAWKSLNKKTDSALTGIDRLTASIEAKTEMNRIQHNATTDTIYRIEQNQKEHDAKDDTRFGKMQDSMNTLAVTMAGERRQP